MSEFIGRVANQTGDNTSQIGREGENINVLPVLLQEKAEIWNCRRKTFTRTVTGGFIVGHDDYSYVGSTFDTHVGSTGPSDPQVYELQYVQNAHNLFYEGFYNERFIDIGSSTGAIVTGSDWYQVDFEKDFFTDFIAKEDKVYKSVTLNINSRLESGSDASALWEAWAIISGSWFRLDINDTTTLPNVSSEGMKLQIKNTGMAEGPAEQFGEEGLSFPINLGTTTILEETGFITDFTVQYSE